MHQLDTKLNWDIAGLYFGKFTVGGQSLSRLHAKGLTDKHITLYFNQLIPGIIVILSASFFCCQSYFFPFR